MVHKPLHFIFRMCDNVSVISIKQLSRQRRADLCVCQQSTGIIYFTRRSIFDVDTIWIFIESYKKIYNKVDGKRRGCRNVTLFDPIINRYFVRESSLKDQHLLSSRHEEMKSNP